MGLSDKMTKNILEIEKFKKANKGYWYNYEIIPQNNYMQYNALIQLSDRKALNFAKRLNSNFEYKIKDVVK